jgi:MoaA/NifB/PqqE/SkfB family radical SAM enzyme
MLRIRSNLDYVLDKSLYDCSFVSIEHDNSFITKESEKRKAATEQSLISEKLKRIVSDLWQKHTRLFKLISVETCSGCNLTCSFCPVNKLLDRRPPGILPNELLEKIAFELKLLNYSSAILLFCNNEPLLDDRIFDIVALFRKACPNSYIKLLTNGTLLTAERALFLFKQGLTTLTINNYSTKGNLISSVQEIISNAEKFYYYDMRVSLRNPDEKLTNRAGHLSKAPIINAQRLFCALPFVDLTVSYTGTVIQCCFDALNESRIGDIKKSSLKDIWFSRQFSGIRESLLNSSRKNIPLCSICDFDGFRDPFQDNSEPLRREDLL